ncbi:MAG: efflux RND transporter periplasmic adaptor subunit [Proteobacteria bacterium]|nr:efflux RND transporter periplasmic adaptor subunit [Pseudomonadota bacterium]
MDESPIDATLAPRLRRGARIALVIAALVAIVGIGMRLYEGSRVARWTEAQAVPTVALVPLRQGGVPRELVLPGTIRAFIDAPINARVSGYLKRWYVDIGAPVRAGQLLAEIETPELDQQLLQAEADLRTAKANLELAGVTAARWQRMRSSDAVSQQEADEKAGDYAAKQAIAAAAEANVARLRATTEFKRLVAPFGGVVTARRTDIGALISAGGVNGQELFRVTDSRRVRVYVDVPQNYAAIVRKGLQAQLRVPEHPGDTYPAIVTDSSQAISESSRTMLVQLEADNARGALLPGAYVDVRFSPNASAAAAPRLPVSALIFRREGMRIAIVDDGGHARLRPIEIGRDLGNEVEVLAGVAATDRIIDNPPDSLSDGDPVRVATATAKGTAGP